MVVSEASKDVDMMHKTMRTFVNLWLQVSIFQTYSRTKTSNTFSNTKLDLPLTSSGIRV